MLRLVSVVGRAAIQQRQFHGSQGVFKLLVEKVPALGESITEGSIASWSKAEGDRVNVDDVIVIVETDKVTVDIKSSHAGVFKKRLATENVIVGNPLYEIDTDDSSTPAPVAPAAAKTVVPAAAPAKEVPADASTGHQHTQRHPLIKFIGKRDKTKKPEADIKPAAAPVAAAPAKKSANCSKKEGNGVHFTTLKGMALYGRPQFTAREIEAIESGGATA